MRALVAGSDRRLRDSVLDALDDAGFTVDVVDRPEDAILCVVVSEYDVVVLDDVMCNSGVIDSSKHGSRGELTTPFLVVASDNRPASRMAALDRGADDCIAADTSADELLARIRSLVRGSGWRSAATSDAPSITGASP